MKADNKKEIRTLSLRIPEKVAKLAEKRAKAQNRSLNAQIVHEVEFNGLPKTRFTKDTDNAQTL